MSEHVEHETLSALLDEPEAWPAARAHLDACPACRREFELMRRMRMALSALGELEPPTGSWDAISARLPGGSPARGWRRFLADDGWVGGSIRAAAAVILFAGGVGLGLWVAAPPSTGTASGVSATASSPTSPKTSEEADATTGPVRTTGAASHVGSRGPATAAGLRAASVAEGGGSDSVTLPSDLPRPYRALYSRLEALRASGPSPAEALRDPQAAAEHLARLDALIRASREALQNAPADPAINDFLFQVVSERNALDRALHVASLEYR